MKLYLSLLSIILLSCVGSKSIQQSEITAIYWGKSFGLCRGYCYSEYQFQAEGSRLIRRSWDTVHYPQTIEAFAPKPDEWTEMKGLISMEEFNQLPERIGCPDCADGGAEWVQIIGPGYSKKVLFEYGSSPTGLEGLLAKLRERQ